MGKQGGYRAKGFQWGQQPWGSSSSEWGSSSWQQDAHQWESENWEKNQPGGKKNPKEAGVFPKYSEVQLPPTATGNATATQPTLMDKNNADQIKEVQRLVNVIRKADAKLRKHQEQDARRTDQWELFQQQLKASFMEQRAAYIQDNVKSAAEATILQEQKTAAAKQLQDLVNGQPVECRKPSHVSMTPEDADAWQALLGEDKEAEDADDPWLQEALSAFAAGTSGGAPSDKAKLQAWLERHSQMISSSSPMTPPRSTTMGQPMTPRDKNRAPTRVVVRQGPQPNGTVDGGQRGLGAGDLPMYGSVPVCGVGNDPYQGSPLPVQPLGAGSSMRTTSPGALGIKQKPKRGENKTQGEVGYGRTPLKEASKMSPKPLTPNQSTIRRQEQMEAKRAEATRQLNVHSATPVARHIIHDDGSESGGDTIGLDLTTLE